jgi:hypothetical protein
VSKLKRFALISTLCSVGLILYSWVGFSQTPQPSVRLTTTPAVSQIHPFEAEATAPQAPVQLTLQALDAAGQPLQPARMHLKILTPPANPWWPTDFPVVEGTTLLDMVTPAPQGQVAVQQMLPMRGTYQLLVDVTPIAPQSFTPFQQTLRLSVPENGVKFYNLAILAVILLMVGLGGGWVIGRRQPIQPGEVAPQRVRLLLSGVIGVAIAALLYINVSAELEQTHMSMPMSHDMAAAPPAAQPAQRQSQGLAMALTGDVHATVGQLAQLQVRVVDAKTQQPITDAMLKVTTTQLENKWVAFAHTGGLDPAGTFSWQQQFFDGAPHNIAVEVAPRANAARQFQPFQVAQTIAVEGVAPPLPVRLIALAYFTGIVILGFLVGFKLPKRSTGAIA